MRHDKPESILPSTNESPGLSLAGGDDFLSRINSTITNFKELIKIVQQVRGLEGMMSADNENPNPEPGQKSLSSPNPMAQFVQLIIALGYGDTPIGELITKVSPYTTKQLIAMTGKLNVGPKQ